MNNVYKILSKNILARRTPLVFESFARSSIMTYADAMRTGLLVAEACLVTYSSA